MLECVCMRACTCVYLCVRTCVCACVHTCVRVTVCAWCELESAARIILDCHYLTPSKDMFCTLKWLPMKDWVRYRKATMTFKAINGNAPDYISSMFKEKFTVEPPEKLVKMICIFRPGPSSMFSGIRYDTLVLKYGMIYLQT